MTNESSNTREDRKRPNKSTVSSEYRYSMSLAPRVDQNSHWFQLLPIAFFSAVIIMITHMAVYKRSMDQFFWSGNENQASDFFSYYKMTAIIACAVIVLLLVLYRVFSQTFAIRKSFAYIPMAIYAVFVLLSYMTSEYKVFSLLGYNDRFEGTLPILGYMIMLFYIINTVRTEHDVKWVIYPIAATSALLGLLGLSQATGHDFFRTAFGKKLITPSWFWNQVDTLNFTFKNKEIYQTVYNINYVSFYLTLLIPLFGLLFIRSIMKGRGEPVWKKLLWGALFTLLIYNLIGSASSGGLLGMAIVVLVGILLLNKRILQWWKPVLILVCITIVIAGISYTRWLPELTSSINGVLGRSTTQESDYSAQDNKNVVSTTPPKIDYLTTKGDSIVVSAGGNEINLKTYFDDPLSISATDSSKKPLELMPTEDVYTCRINDPRFDWLLINPAKDESKTYDFYVLNINGTEWPFMLTKEGPKYVNGLGKTVELKDVPAIGWKDNQEFGSGRGYIWSRSIPMMKDTVMLGHGADTFCLYFPQDDYVGKYNSGSFTSNIDIVVDKPHNMYIGIALGTGAISLLALLTLWAIYIIQSIQLYRKEKYAAFNSFVGAGIFLGVCGFLVAAIVNDSSVSTMPLFYGLLGTGIAINSMMAREKKLSEN